MAEMNETRDVINHIEKFLGKMAWGYSIQGFDFITKIQVARFDNQPMQGATTFVTTGLSSKRLTQTDYSNIRQELVFCFRGDESLFEEIAKLLGLIASDVITSGQALIRGQVLGPAGPLFTKSTLKALYITYPVYFPEEFHKFLGSRPQTSFVWLVPIHSSENHYINTCGWSSFENALEVQDPDLLDLDRCPIKIN